MIKPASALALGLAAQAWCEKETSDRVMDPPLAEAFARILDRYIDALQWCSGSADFGPDGQAHVGWRKVQEELLTLDGWWRGGGRADRGHQA